MKVLVLSHACITPVNQSFYATVADLTGWEIQLVIPSSWNTEYSETTEVRRWPTFCGKLHSISVWKPGNIPLHLYKSSFIRLLRTERPDAIYVHHEPYGLATAQMYLANQVVDNCPIGFYSAQNIIKNYPAPFSWLEQYVMRRSSFCFPVTEGALDVLRSKSYGGSATVLPLPLDCSIYQPEPVAASALRVAHRISKASFVIGFVGRFVEEKGIATLLHALSLLRGVDWCFVLAGSGPCEDDLRALVSTLGLNENVRFVGFVPHADTPSLLSMFDVLVLPSETRKHWKEQFGRVIIEANACGTPVIGTDSGEIPNVIGRTGGGLVVPEANPQALCQAIESLAISRKYSDQLAAKGLAMVSALYNQEVIASEFASTISQALTRGRF